jgi:hypothetical protein
MAKIIRDFFIGTIIAHFQGKGYLRLRRDIEKFGAGIYSPLGDQKEYRSIVEGACQLHLPFVFGFYSFQPAFFQILFYPLLDILTQSVIICQVKKL